MKFPTCISYLRITQADSSLFGRDDLNVQGAELDADASNGKITRNSRFWDIPPPPFECGLCVERVELCVNDDESSMSFLLISSTTF